MKKHKLLKAAFQVCASEGLSFHTAIHTLNIQSCESTEMLNHRVHEFVLLQNHGIHFKKQRAFTHSCNTHSTGHFYWVQGFYTEMCNCSHIWFSFTCKEFTFLLTPCALCWELSLMNLGELVMENYWLSNSWNSFFFFLFFPVLSTTLSGAQDLHYSLCSSLWWFSLKPISAVSEQN